MSQTVWILQTTVPAPSAPHQPAQDTAELQQQGLAEAGQGHCCQWSHNTRSQQNTENVVSEHCWRTQSSCGGHSQLQWSPGPGEVHLDEDLRLQHGGGGADGEGLPSCDTLSSGSGIHPQKTFISSIILWYFTSLFFKYTRVYNSYEGEIYLYYKILYQLL